MTSVKAKAYTGQCVQHEKCDFHEHSKAQESSKSLCQILYIPYLKEI